MIDPLRPDSGFGIEDGWAAARAQDCRGRGRIPALRRRGTAAIAAPNQKGAGAEGGAVRPHNRRLVGVLSRRRGRSSILGHYSGSEALGVRAFRLGECRESGWSAVRLSYAVSRPRPPSLRPSRLSAPLTRPKQPPRYSPPCLRAAQRPPPAGPDSRASPEVGAAPAPAGESGADPPGAPAVPHCQGLLSTRRS